MNSPFISNKFQVHREIMGRTKQTARMNTSGGGVKKPQSNHLTVVKRNTPLIEIRAALLSRCEKLQLLVKDQQDYIDEQAAELKLYRQLLLKIHSDVEDLIK